jgi:prepilin-type N-terminal cleavage/methylation domain-containing protein/prepilin-type processing-associated H-X9-DG protein
MRKNRGFTLIELLVVIAIIALLLSVLMPALKLVKEKVKNLYCRANIRSLSVGFRLYTEDNDGKVFGYGSAGGNNLWLMQIEDQLGNIDKIRYCPSTRIDESWPFGTGTSTIAWRWGSDEYGSFGMNGFLYSSTPTFIVPADEWGLSAWMSSVVTANSASIPIFVDARWVDLWPQDDDEVPDLHDLEEGAQGGDGADRTHMLRCMIDRHGGAMSVSFLDGHVEPVDLKKMWSLKWSRQFATDAQEQFREDGTTPIYIK